ncbi:MAG: alpha/beta hydrolase [Pseudomonadota bacterium]
MGTFRTSDGLTLAYDDQGEGPAILCLSGLTRCARDFNYVLPHLPGRVIRLDYRGRGRSDWAAPETYTIPIEARDVIELLNQLGLERVAVLGTSRGGLIALLLAATAKDRLSGVCLNDIGPEIAPDGMAVIRDYIGVAPSAKTYAEAEAQIARRQPGFSGVPASRWAEEVRHFYDETPDGLALRYDPDLRVPVLANVEAEAPDLWPFFDALAGLPLALIRGENSNILSAETTAEMRARRPDMIVAQVPGRGHVPFLDEPQALAAIAEWTAKLS